MEIKIQRLDKTIELPRYAHHGDAAFDLRARGKEVIEPGKFKVVKTGIKVAIPLNHVGLVWDRSGLSSRNGLHCMAGVIDSGYRGELGVVMINHGSEKFEIEKGMRIAQMLVQPVLNNVPIIEVDDLEATERGEKGYGSSGHQ